MESLGGRVNRVTVLLSHRIATGGLLGERRSQCLGQRFQLGLHVACQLGEDVPGPASGDQPVEHATGNHEVRSRSPRDCSTSDNTDPATRTIPHTISPRR